MKPESLIATQRTQRLEIVDGADVHGTGRTDHEKRPAAGAAVRGDPGAQCRHVDTMQSIDRDATQCIAAEAGEVHRLRDAAVSRGRSISGQRRALLADAAEANRWSERRGSRHQHRHQIGHRRAGDEKTACLLRQTEHRAHPFDDLAFDLDRDMIAAAEIGIQSGREHLRQHSDRGAAAMHPSHESGMNVSCRIGDDEIGELAIDFVKIARLARQLGAEPGADPIGYRRPDRTVADAGGVVEHVVEHAMTQRTKSVPVLRIERLARFG